MVGHGPIPRRDLRGEGGHRVWGECHGRCDTPTTHLTETRTVHQRLIVFRLRPLYPIMQPQKITDHRLHPWRCGNNRPPGSLIGGIPFFLGGSRPRQLKKRTLQIGTCKWQHQMSEKGTIKYYSKRDCKKVAQNNTKNTGAMALQNSATKKAPSKLRHEIA